MNLASLGQTLLVRVELLNLWTAALVGAAFAIDAVLSRRVRAAWRVALYAPVALRLVLPLGWGVARAPGVDTVLAPALRISAGTAAGATSWISLLVVLYASVALALVARAVVARVRLHRALATGESRDGVVVHDRLGPLVAGVWSPRIVVPARLRAPGAEDALACVLAHERAHVRRLDPWLAVAMQALTIAAWPVVPVWLAAARVRQLVELACDEAALAGADPVTRRHYGHVLLDMAEVAATSAGELHFGSTLRARILALASVRRWPVAAQALAMGAAGLLLACTSVAPVEDPLKLPGYGYAFEADRSHGETDAAEPVEPKGGRMPPETIQATVRARFGIFRNCYESALGRNPRLEGTVSVRFVFGGDGVVKTAQNEGSTLPDEAVVACVVEGFRAITYPATSAGDVSVVYPIVFAQ